MVRLAVETAARAEEILAMTVTDIDMRRGMAIIRRGKGAADAGSRSGRTRRRPSTATCGSAGLTGSPARPRCGSGTARGKGLAYYGLRNPLAARLRRPGSTGSTFHRLRHTAASRWLEAGREGGLMAVAGWRSWDMTVGPGEEPAAAGEAKAMPPAKVKLLGALNARLGR